MIETPTATAFKSTTVDPDSKEIDAPLLSDDMKSDEKAGLHAVEQDLFLVKQAPITGKMRTAVKHLRSVAGPWSRFRGFHVALLYNLIHSAILNFFAPSLGSGIVRPFVSIIASVVLCRFGMLWTHIVISNPSPKRWYQRFPSVAQGKNIIIPATVCAIASQTAVAVPANLWAMVMDQVHNPEMYGEDRERTQKIALIQMFGVVLIAISTVFCIVIPAEVTLKRVQASMLPEEDEAIVPFDRTFAGKVKPEILGGSGCVGMLDAWKTFDKAGRLRLIKLYAKIFAIQFTLIVALVMTLVGELKFVMGDDFHKGVKMAHEAVKF